MNYFAHLTLAQPTAASKVGNLLGDFMRGVDEASLPLPVRLGLRNHRLVDRFTDMHPRVRESRWLFSPQRRRFAGVALDVLFDHFLIRHWSRFYTQSLDSVITRDYALLRQGEILMPAPMRRTTERLVSLDIFRRYQDLDQLAEVLDRIAGRIRFANRFEGSIEDIRVHYDELEQVFLAVYPQLRRVVRGASVERGR
ncbi:ACP phosphodiesterase [Alcanivorax sp.]|jgi:acyl carrier protein phosphodiesterase|uniref:acyl carrier protein phosphodiesterase n=1 Tax=Alcanivorax sp. TaxID=1872427 RepID=UPI0019CA1627|nr:ACP phosphodiesterase [Alcanivorax sp.]MBD3642912.1 DUF479 domain-containing protein [Alcanivorax sp.]